MQLQSQSQRWQLTTKSSWEQVRAKYAEARLRDVVIFLKWPINNPELTGALRAWSGYIINQVAHTSHVHAPLSMDSDYMKPIYAACSRTGWT